MDADAVRSLYDEGYAEKYDERFLLNGWSRHNAEFEVELLGQLLDRNAAPGPATSWLDVACGTGWFLERFRGVPRAGLDLAPAMLALARERNPDAIELREGSYLDAHDDWAARWDVVSCMWFAYCYAGSLARVEDLMRHLVEWTAVGGSILLPVCWLEILAGGRSLPYENRDIGVFGGPLRLTSVTWEWTDEIGGKHHEHLVAPHVEHLSRLFAPHFEEIAVVTYPKYEPDSMARVAILARRKRAHPEFPVYEAASPPRLTATSAARRRGRYWGRRVRRKLRR